MKLQKAKSTDRKIRLSTYNSLVDNANLSDKNDRLKGIPNEPFSVTIQDKNVIRIKVGNVFCGNDNILAIHSNATSYATSYYKDEYEYALEQSDTQKDQYILIETLGAKYVVSDVNPITEENTEIANGIRTCYVIVSYSKDFSATDYSNFGDANYMYVYITNSLNLAGKTAISSLTASERKKYEFVRSHNWTIAEVDLYSNGDISEVRQTYTGDIHFPNLLPDSRFNGIITTTADVPYYDFSSYPDLIRYTIEPSQEEPNSGALQLHDIDRVPKSSYTTPYFASGSNLTTETNVASNVVSGQLSWSSYDSNYRTDDYQSFASDFYQKTIEIRTTGKLDHTSDANVSSSLINSNCATEETVIQLYGVDNIAQHMYSLASVRTGNLSDVANASATVKSEMAYIYPDTYLTDNYTKPTGSQGADVIRTIAANASASIEIVNFTNNLTSDGVNGLGLGLYDFQNPVAVSNVASDLLLIRRDVDGTPTLKYVDISTIAGPQGEQGPQGPAGADGSDANITNANVAAVISHHSLSPHDLSWTEGGGHTIWDDHGSTARLDAYVDPSPGAYRLLMAGNGAGAFTSAQLFTRNDGPNYLGNSLYVQNNQIIEGTTDVTPWTYPSGSLQIQNGGASFHTAQAVTIYAGNDNTDIKLDAADTQIGSDQVAIITPSLTTDNTVDSGTGINLTSNSLAEIEFINGIAVSSSNVASQMTQSIIPNASNVYALGSDSNRWSSIYVADQSIHIGEAGNESIISYSNVANSLSISTEVNVSSHFITDLLDPVNPQDAATKYYVDNNVPDLSGYLTVTNAASTYLTINNASSTYLTQSNAASIYIPYSGATGAVDLNAKALSNVSTLTATTSVITPLISTSASNLSITPSTGIASISATTPELRLIGTGTNQYSRLNRTSTNDQMYLYNQVLTPISATDLIPDMTSNTAPSGTVLYNSQGYGSSAWWAFDDNDGSTWISTDSLPSYIGYQFTSGQVINTYTLSPRPAPNNANSPTSWQFQGSNDGSNWTTLDTRTSDNLGAGTTKKTYSFSNATSYTHYRILISAVYDGLTRCGVREFEMMAGAVTYEVAIIDSKVSAVTDQKGIHTFGATSGLSNWNGALHNFQINGTTKANIEANGRFFIGGTTSATALLHLAAGTATASTAPLKLTSGTLLSSPEAGAIEFLTDKYYGTITTGAARKELALMDAAGTAGSVYFAGTNGRITQDNANFFWDDTNNRLGIGTSAPSDLLHVYGIGNQGLTLEATTNGTVASYFKVKTATRIYGMTSEPTASTAGGADSLNFYDYTANAYRMAIKSSGNVGIGTTAPVAKLHIAGSSSTGLQAESDTQLVIKQAITNGISLRMGVDTSGSKFSWLQSVEANVSADRALSLNPAGGKVGIGITAPTSTLHVNGSVTMAYAAKTANYTLTASDYTVECTANSFTITLPTAVGITGRTYKVKNTGSGTITVDADGTQTIDGELTQAINQWDCLTITSNGANWIIT